MPEVSGVSGLTGTTTTSPPTVQTPKYKQTMDSELFMTLLVAQLKNQDPSSPMDTNAMIAQSVQLASMEQMTSLSSTTSESFSLQMRVAAANLVGKQVTYTDATGTSITGLAESVSYTGTTPIVTVGGASVSLDSITGITTTPS